MEILTKIVSVLVTPLIAFGGFVHDIVAPTVLAPVVQYVPEYIEIPQEAPKAGATVPSAVALFSDSLQNAISSSDTSFTLVRGTDKTGTALASSTYGFIIDEGEANEEMVLANCTGTVCTGVIRGINPVSGTSTTASLQKSHRRGASVKITDGPILITLSQIARGREGFGAIIKYDASVGTSTFSSADEIINKGYVDYVAFNGAGVVTASESAMGVGEIATAGEVANGTTNGATGRLIIPASLASSTRVAGAGQGIVVVTDSTGMIDDEFLPRTIASTTTFTSTTTLTGTTSIGVGGMVFSSGNRVDVFSTTSTAVWTKPSGAKFVEVIVIGAGGGGGSGDIDTNAGAGGGGGGGGYSRAMFNASAFSSTVLLTVGVGGTGGVPNGISSGSGSAGGFSEFGSSTAGTNIVYLKATGGGAGVGSSGAGNDGAGGAAGVGNEENGSAGSSAGGAVTATKGAPTGGSGGVGSSAASGGSISYLIEKAGGTGCTTEGTSGVNGSSTPSNTYTGGTGGGGGCDGGLSVVTGGNGGAGGNYGGGGGGGADSDATGEVSGSGGRGGDGVVVVISYF